MAIQVGNWGGGAVWRVTSGAFPSNAYVCETRTPDGCILIDAGLDGPAIDAAMAERGLLPGEDPDTLRQSIRGLWDRLTAIRIIYPGHGDVADGASIRTGNSALLKFLGLAERDGEAR